MLSEPAWVFPYCCIFFYFILISISNSFILKWCQLSSPVLTCLCLHRLLLKMNETSIKTLQCLQFVTLQCCQCISTINTRQWLYILRVQNTKYLVFLLLLFFPPLKNMITAQMKRIPNERNLHSSSVISLKFVLMSFWSFLSLNLESLCVCI